MSFNLTVQINKYCIFFIIPATFESSNKPFSYHNFAVLPFDFAFGIFVVLFLFVCLLICLILFNMKKKSVCHFQLFLAHFFGKRGNIYMCGHWQSITNFVLHRAYVAHITHTKYKSKSYFTIWRECTLLWNHAISVGRIYAFEEKKNVLKKAMV